MMNKEATKIEHMPYDPIQYYCDELTQWSRIIEFQKEESAGILRQITLGLEKEKALTKSSESNNHLDQFMVQEQKCDHLMNQLSIQQQRLDRETRTSVTPVEESIIQAQDIIRSRMHANEKNFIRIKYACYVFLSELFQGQIDLRSKSAKKVIEI